MFLRRVKNISPYTWTNLHKDRPQNWKRMKTPRPGQPRSLQSGELGNWEPEDDDAPSGTNDWQSLARGQGIESYFSSRNQKDDGKNKIEK